MGFDAVATIATILLVVAEVAAPSWFRLSAVSVATSILLLLARSTERCFFLMAVLLTCCAGGAYGAKRLATRLLLQCRSASSDSSAATRRREVIQVLATVPVGIFHLLAMFVLPFCIVLSAIHAQTDEFFFAQEIAHLTAASFYVSALVLLPLLVLPPGYQHATVQHHQLYESIYNSVVSLIWFLIFRTVHHMHGWDPPNHISAANWDHEFLGMIFFGAGLVGLFLALQDIPTSIHICFPTAFVAYTMLSHSDAHHHGFDDETEYWKYTWMKMHWVHGVLFLVGALCRLLHKVPESIFFYFLGSFALVLSAKWNIRALHNAVVPPPNPNDTRRYPSEHVVPLLVVSAASIMYAVFLGTSARLRMFWERELEKAANDGGSGEDGDDGKGAFKALPMQALQAAEEDPHDDDDEVLFDDDDEYAGLNPPKPPSSSSSAAFL